MLSDLVNFRQRSRPITVRAGIYKKRKSIIGSADNLLKELLSTGLAWGWQSAWHPANADEDAGPPKVMGITLLTSNKQIALLEDLQIENEEGYSRLVVIT